jgi:hypothetical protein
MNRFVSGNALQRAEFYRCAMHSTPGATNGSVGHAFDQLEKFLSITKDRDAGLCCLSVIWDPRVSKVL